MPVLQVSNKPADAKKALRKAVPSMFTSFSVNTPHGDLHFNGFQADAVSSFISKLLSSRVRVVAGPHVCSPIPNFDRLYLRLQYTEGTPKEAIHAYAKDAAAKHGGLNIKGECIMGMPVRSGNTYQIPVWFHGAQL